MAVPLKLLWVGNFASVQNGIRTVSASITEQLAQSGWESIKVSYRTNRVYRLLDVVFTILYRQQQYDFACVEVYSGMAFLWAEIASVLLTWLRKPLVLILHGGGLLEFSIEHRDRIVQLLNRGSVVVTPSLFLKKGLTPLFSNIRYIPNGLSIKAYPFRLRDKVGRILLWLRAFHQTYQPQMAVQILANLVKEFPDVKLIMVGPNKNDGSLEQVLQDARRLNVDSQLSVIGMVASSEIPLWLDRADIFINTTLFESFGISVMEAAACGLPIATTNVGELPFLWQDGNNALLAPADDLDSMTDIVCRLLRDDNLVTSLSRKARDTAEEYDWEIILPQWHRLFQDLIHG